MTTTYEEMNDDYLKYIEGKGYTHYKARAECFPDVISAFHIIHIHNMDVDKTQRIPIISPTIKGSSMGDTDFDFWTNTPIKSIQMLWDRKGSDLHRLIQTIKPIDKYDGKTDNSFWKE